MADMALGTSSALTPASAPLRPAVKPPKSSSPHAPLHSALEAEHSSARDTMGKLQEARKTLSTVREELDKLQDLGDQVQPGDLTKAAGKIVAAGLDARAVAGMLSSAPTQSDALAQWVKAQDAQVTQREAQLAQAFRSARNAQGAGALRHLAGLSLKDEPQVPELLASAQNAAGPLGQQASAAPMPSPTPSPLGVA